MKSGKRMLWVVAGLLLFLVGGLPMRVTAQEASVEDSMEQLVQTEAGSEAQAWTEEQLDQYMEELGISYDQVEEEMRRLFGESLSFRQLVTQLVLGETTLDLSFFKTCVQRIFRNPLANTKGLFAQILLIGALSAVFSIGVSAFGNQQTGELSFYIVFLLLLVVLMKSFVQVTGVLEETVSAVMAFCKVLMPVYVLVVAVSGHMTTAAVFYEFFLFLVYVVQWLVLYVLLPMIRGFVVLGMVNQLLKEDLFSKMADFLKTLVGWVLKTLLGLVIGFQVLQSLLTPYVDQFRSGTVHKALQAVPGVGGTMHAATEMLAGAGILIKNGVGTAALLVLCFLCVTPVVTIFLYGITYQVARVLLQPIAEKRVGTCVEYVQDGTWLLLRTLLMIGLLFFLTVAVLAASTNGGA